MYVWGKKQGVHVDQSGMWVAVDPCNVFFLLFTFGTLATIENIHYIVVNYLSNLHVSPSTTTTVICRYTYFLCIPTDMCLF